MQDSCGTMRGFRRHKTHSTEICEPCRQANRDYMKEWGAKNRESLRKVSQTWRDNNRERNREINARGYINRDKDKHKEYLAKRYREDAYAHRNSEFKRKFGITLEDKARMLEAQGNCCDCCSRTEPGTKGWQMDHNHTTLQLRGVTCTNCNCGLGHFQDDIAKLKAAIAYLEKYQNKEMPKVPDRVARKRVKKEFVLNEKIKGAIVKGKTQLDENHKAIQSEKEEVGLSRRQWSLKETQEAEKWIEDELPNIVTELTSRGARKYTTKSQHKAEAARCAGLEVTREFVEHYWDEGINYGGYYVFNIKW